MVTDETGIPSEHLVKDFWVTEVLRGVAAAANSRGLELYFKGGTSLSKAYKLIRRFSEDVDVLIALSPDSKSVRDAHLQAIVDAAADSTGLTGVDVPGTKTSGVKRSARFHYPSTGAAVVDAGVSDGVLLELGTRGGVLPGAHVIEIRSLLSEFRPVEMSAYAEHQPFTAPVLAPVRTLIEKLVLLHTAHTDASEGSDKQKTVIRKAARHYYDVYQLLNAGDVVEQATGHVKTLARDVVTYSAGAGLPGLAPGGAGFAASPAFNDSTFFKIAAAEYERVMPLLVWPGAEMPSFADCCAAVHRQAEVLK